FAGTWRQSSCFATFQDSPTPTEHAVPALHVARGSQPLSEMGGGGALSRGEFSVSRTTSGRIRPTSNELVDELSAASPEFARWWKAHEIRPKPSGTKVMTHPKLGRGTLLYS